MGEDERQATDARTSAEKTRQAAEDAANKAQEAKEEAESSRKLAEEKADEAARLFHEAEATMEKLKKFVTGAGRGKVWYLERAMEEQKKYMSPMQLAKLEKKIISIPGPTIQNPAQVATA